MTFQKLLDDECVHAPLTYRTCGFCSGLVAAQEAELVEDQAEDVLVLALFASVCPECDAPISSGELIRRSGEIWAHVQCPT